jgi:hypothetical protein
VLSRSLSPDLDHLDRLDCCDLGSCCVHVRRGQQGLSLRDRDRSGSRPYTAVTDHFRRNRFVGTFHNSLKRPGFATDQLLAALARVVFRRVVMC